MLVLLFYLGDVMYTMKCEKVREVAPLVKLKEMPHTPDYFAGLFNYRGVIVPCNRPAYYDSGTTV